MNFTTTLSSNEEYNLNKNSTENQDKIYEWINTTFFGVDYGLILSLPSTKSSEISKLENSFDWVKFLWIIIFSVMITVAIGGNCIVIWIIIAHRKLRTVTNYFLVNLSLADLLLITLNCTFNFSYMIQKNWPFGSVYCTVSNFIANATVAASVFTLTGISFDRYLAIVHPLQPRISKASSLITITFIWLMSMIVAIPCLLYSTIITERYREVEKSACILIWPDKKLVGSKYDFVYQIFFLITTYLIPIVLMSISYTIMGRELWGSRSIGELTQRQIDSIKSKRKVVKMFILVVFIFTICWLPYHGYFLYVYYDPSIIFSKYTQHIYLGFYWIAMSNAMVNPLIYYWMNARQYFKTAICCWRNCIIRKNDQSFDIHDRKSNSNYRSGLYGSSRKKLHENEVPSSPYKKDTRIQNVRDQRWHNSLRDTFKTTVNL